MKTEKSLKGYYPERVQELQNKFRDLEPSIHDSGTKEALSILYGIVQELLRKVEDSGHKEEGGGISLKEIASLYRNAPKMNGAALNTPLAEGTKAPDFSLSDANGNTVKLWDFRGTPVLLVFYPLDWSPGCSQQLDLYQHEFIEFEKRGVSIVGISVDSIYSHGAWSVVRNIHFPLLADFNPKGAVARRFHVYRDEDGFSERALYIIDGDGVIRFSYVSPYVHHIPDIYGIFEKLDEVLKSATV